MRAATSILGLCLLLSPTESSAASEKTLDYRYTPIWSAAVRLIRADRGYTIKDKDKDTGYILFVYPGSGSVKECSASLELVPIVDDRGYERIRVKLLIQHQPSYVEVHLLDALEQKLRDELGSATPRKAPAKPTKPERR
jgi:hypothetical protein